ncbi:DNA-J related domain-containing protein [Rheinheimera sp. FR7-31]|uniref:DNA-J related domain-containing protein n=1 Tax=Rheinheimera fenheensis TaxID=3152295 RepID=UPI00325ED767
MTYLNAPLTEPVLALLQGQLLNIICTAPVAAAEPIEEQYLLNRLGLKLQSEAEISADLARFQQHFVLYHLLFRLQSELLELNQGYLCIGLAKVQLLAPTALPEAEGQDSRRNYYMNWQNFYQMTEQLLDQHIDAFWQHVLASGKAANVLAYSEARAVLQLTDDFSQAELKRAYRSLALQHHPDRGGSAEQFILLRQAYQQLRQ